MPSKKRSRTELETNAAAAPVSNKIENLPELAEVEEPVLSHKAKRQKKKIPPVEATAAVTSEGAPAVHPDRQAVVKNAASSSVDATLRDLTGQKRSGFGVWIGNMNFKSSASNLKAFLLKANSAPLAQEGDEDVVITRINMPSGRSQLEFNKGSAGPALAGNESYAEIQSLL